MEAEAEAEAEERVGAVKWAVVGVWEWAEGEERTEAGVEASAWVLAESRTVAGRAAGVGAMRAAWMLWIQTF